MSQIADKECSLAPLYRWFKCKLKPPKKVCPIVKFGKMRTEKEIKYCSCFSYIDQLSKRKFF